MKKFIIIALFIISSMHVFAQDSKTIYENKVKKFKTMRNLGIGFTAGGVAGTIGGVALIVNGVNQNDNYNSNYSGSDGTASIIGGVFLTAFGIGSTVTGIVLTSIGAAGTHKYNQKIKNLTFNFNGMPSRGVVSLAYKF